MGVLEYIRAHAVDLPLMAKFALALDEVMEKLKESGNK
jgi:hypothetical protein